MTHPLLSFALLGAACCVPLTAATCESLASLSLPQTKITSASQVSAGPFAPSASDASVGEVPAFCRVTATLTPSADSDIKVEVWMPLARWNVKFQAVGNGGWGGSLNYAALATAVSAGYATASTDTGHTGVGASFGFGHPEKVIDYAYRSEHEMTVKAKAIVTAFYGQAPKLSYWNGCSSGGKQALKEAQRFPNDYDGIIAGAPTSNWTGRSAQSIWIAQAVHKDEASYIPPDKYPFIHDAVLEACDRLDGVKDGVLDDPRRCQFDPKVLECRTPDTSKCLTAPQAEAARKIYADPKNPRTGKVISPGLERGSELGWANLAGPLPFIHGDEYFKYVVFANPNWDYQTLNFDRDIERAEAMDADRINALDSNLKAFFAHGGKLLQYHGWSDQQISPRNSINYYNSVLETMGGRAAVDQSYRLFMIPGFAHCRGGDGTETFDMLSPLETWVEQGKAPDVIPAARVRNGKLDRTRPLCPYPQRAVYRNSGSSDDAANFACVQ